MGSSDKITNLEFQIYEIFHKALLNTVSQCHDFVFQNWDKNKAFLTNKKIVLFTMLKTDILVKKIRRFGILDSWLYLMRSKIIFHFLSSVGSPDPPVATALHLVIFKLHKYLFFTVSLYFRSRGWSSRIALW